MQREKLIRVLIVEPSRIIRTGLSVYLKQGEAFNVVAEAETGEEALGLVETTEPDVVHLEVGLPDMDGASFVRRLKSLNPEIKIIVSNSDVHEERLFDALKAGADAYCLKSSSPERLVETIHSVCEGGAWLDPPMARKVFSLFTSGNVTTSGILPGALGSGNNKHYRLSDREHRILSLIVAGKSNTEIASELCVSYHTIKSEITSILQKLSVHDRTQAAVKALKEHLI
jgi:DNA-binding NarL/FixJ family response regulator